MHILHPLPFDLSAIVAVLSTYSLQVELYLLQSAATVTGQVGQQGERERTQSGIFREKQVYSERLAGTHDKQ